jgi:hypothetical protein
VSLDGIGEIHDQVRKVKRGFDKAGETIAAMEALARKHDQFQFGIAATIFATNMQDAKNILAWARERDLDIVSTCCASPTTCWQKGSRKIHFRRRKKISRLPRSRSEESVLSGQSFESGADAIANGRPTMPCRSGRRPWLSPDGELFYWRTPPTCCRRRPGAYQGGAPRDRARSKTPSAGIATARANQRAPSTVVPCACGAAG